LGERKSSMARTQEGRIVNAIRPTEDEARRRFAADPSTGVFAGVTTSYAIVESGGKQYRAEKGASLVVEHLSADEGAKVSLRAVMYRGDTDVVLEGDQLEKVKVEAVVAEHLRGPKVRIFKYKPKKGYRRRAGHRQELTRLEVTDVRLLTRKPAAKAETKPAEETEAKPKPTPKAKPAAKRPAPKAKPAAKKPAPRKPAAKGKAQTTPKTSTARRSSSAKKD
jgi:large subunit ribosomal protein L21